MHDDKETEKLIEDTGAKLETREPFTENLKNGFTTIYRGQWIVGTKLK